MKWFLSVLILFVALKIGAVQTNQTPILRGVLQSDANGAGYSWTNVGTFRGTNFIDAVTGLPISGGSAPTAGNNIQVVGSTVGTVTNPIFTSIMASNPAAAGSSARITLSGNVDSGGFTDLIDDNPSAFTITPGGSGRPVQVTRLKVTNPSSATTSHNLGVDGSGNVTTNDSAIGGVVATFDPNQFSSSAAGTNVKNGAVFTNIIVRTPGTNTALTIGTNPVSNGGDMVLSFSPGTNKVLIDFGGLANILWNPYHSGGHGELQISADSIAFGMGNSVVLGVPGLNSYRDFQLGIGDGHRGRVRLRQDDGSSSGYWSNPLVFDTFANASIPIAPGMQGASDFTTGLYRVNYYADAHDTLVGTNWDWANWGYMGSMILRTNPVTGAAINVGWDHRGREISERVSDTIVGSTYTLDMTRPKVVDANIGSQQTTVTFSLSEPTSLAGLTNYEKHIFFIRSGGFSNALAWPSGFNVMSPPPFTSASLPNNIGFNQILKLEIESVGIGATNKLVTASIGTDNTFFYDQAVKEFMFRSGLTSLTISNALNNMVASLKADGTWGQLDALYPFVGTTAAQNSWNLVNTNTFKIAWTGSVTHSGGITSDGSTGYGDTGWIQNSQNDSSVFAWCKDWMTGGPQGHVLGGQNASLVGSAIKANSSGLPDEGVNCSLADLNATSVTAPSFPNGFCASRSASGSFAFYRDYNLSQTATSTSATPTRSIYLLTRNDDGSPFQFWTKTVQVVALGKSITQAQYQTLYVACTNLNSVLAR